MQNFTRTIEDFVCEHCGTTVKGNGFTNHCPKCLHSKHVDKTPGDRALKDSCGGLMVPISAEQKAGVWKILHKCQRCGFERKNILGAGDDFERVIEISVQG